MSEVLICECSSPTHQILIHKDEEDGVPVVYAHVHLIRRSFWRRLKYGIKYIFGYKSNYGAWDEFIFNPSDAQKILDIVSHLTISEFKNEK